MTCRDRSLIDGPFSGSILGPKWGSKRGVLGGSKKGHFWGVPGDPPGGGFSAPPAGGRKSRGGGNFAKIRDLGRIFYHLCVPTGRVIKYPRKCAHFCPPRGAPGGGPRDPPKRGVPGGSKWPLPGPLLGPLSGGSWRPPRTPRLREAVLRIVDLIRGASA